jgi:nucleotide-binding universal stress UspA family protein/hemerythrin-like domain-containing protein
MYHHILVPLDATDLSIQVVGGAVALARPLGARITFFHVVEQTGDSLTSDLELLRVTSPEVHDYARSGRARELLAKAEAGARAYGVPCDARWTRGKRPAPAIVEAARTLGCDLIYMASHGHGGKLGMALASDTLSVVLSASLPVLVATATEPAPPERAIAVIRDEHRAIAAVIHAATRMLDTTREAGAAVDADSMTAVVAYLRGFPLTQHHPKEERYLFPSLRARTHAVDAELDELERQHLRDAVLLEELGRLTQALGAADGARRIELTGDLAKAMGQYAELHWEHMGREETVILPAAQQHLQAQDWVALNAAFSEAGAMPEGELSGLDYHHLLARIV